MKLTSILLPALLLVSCSVTFVEPQTGTVEHEFNVSIASGDTRTSVDGGAVQWSEGDVIRYYSAPGGEVRKCVVEASGPACTIKAVTAETDDWLVAAYGGNGISDCLDGSFVVDNVIGEVQDGTFASNHVAVARTSDLDSGSLLFRNVTSFVKFSIESDNVRKVVFSSVGGEKIHGGGTLRVSFSGDVPSGSFGDAGGSEIAIEIPGAGTYYMATLPVTLSSGFAVTCYDSQDVILGIASSARAFEIGLGEIKNLGAVDTHFGPHNVSAAQFNAEPVNNNVMYRVTGTVGTITNMNYGDFYVEDETGSMLFWGASNWKLYKNSIAEGGIITVVGYRGAFNGKAEMLDGYIESYIEYVPPVPVSSGWLELPAMTEEEQARFFRHTMDLDGVEFRNYSFLWDYGNLVAPWVAYPLNAGLIGSGSRTDDWGVDPLLPSTSQPVLTKAFKTDDGLSYDRGHQIPSADRNSQDANIQTFYGTNMTPQRHGFNGGLWANLEAKVRTWSHQCDTLYVVTGCSVEGADKYALDNYGKRVTVPTFYFKALLARTLSGNVGHSGYRACAFWYDHFGTYSTKITSDMAISIDELEEKTGIDFFVNLESLVGESVAADVEAENPQTISWWWN